MHGLSSHDSTNYGQYILHNLVLYNDIECDVSTILRLTYPRRFIEHQFPAEVVHGVSYNTLHDASDNHFGMIACIFDIDCLVYFYSVYIKKFFGRAVDL